MYYIIYKSFINVTIYNILNSFEIYIQEKIQEKSPRFPSSYNVEDLYKHIFPYLQDLLLQGAWNTGNIKERIREERKEKYYKKPLNTKSILTPGV